MFDDKLQMNSKLIYDVFFVGGGFGAPVQAGVRPCRPECARSAPVQAGVRPERASMSQ